MKPTTERWAVIYCGSRSWMAHQPIIASIWTFPNRTMILVGGAEGADRIAEEEAIKAQRENIVLRIPADWQRFGRSAGPRRNALLAALLLRFGEHGYRMAVRAFSHGTPGTQDMVRRLEKNAAVDVRVHGAK